MEKQRNIESRGFGYLVLAIKKILVETFDFVPFILVFVSFKYLFLMGQILGASIGLLLASLFAVSAGMVYRQWQSKFRLLALNCILFCILNYLHYWIAGPPEKITRIHSGLRSIILPQFITSAGPVTLSLLFLFVFMSIFYIQWKISSTPKALETHPQYHERKIRLMLTIRGIQYGALLSLIPIFSLGITFFGTFVSLRHKNAEIFWFTNNILVLATLFVPGNLLYMRLMRRQLCVRTVKTEHKGILQKTLFAVAIMIMPILSTFMFESVRKAYTFWIVNLLLFFGLHIHFLRTFVAGSAEETNWCEDSLFDEEVFKKGYIRISAFSLLTVYFYFFIMMGVATLW
jgi:hypothetical protein